MKINDQLGLVRPEIYEGKQRSWGVYKPEPGHQYQRVHTQTKTEDRFGENVLLVEAKASARIGEAALYAAYLHQTTDETIVCRSHEIDLAIEDLPNVKTPEMTDAEIERRFAVIVGVGDLDISQKRQIIRTALLLNMNFNEILYADDGFLNGPSGFSDLP